MNRSTSGCACTSISPGRSSAEGRRSSRRSVSITRSACTAAAAGGSVLIAWPARRQGPAPWPSAAHDRFEHRRKVLVSVSAGVGRAETIEQHAEQRQRQFLLFGDLLHELQVLERKSHRKARGIGPLAHLTELLHAIG